MDKKRKSMEDGEYTPLTRYVKYEMSPEPIIHVEKRRVKFVTPQEDNLPLSYRAYERFSKQAGFELKIKKGVFRKIYIQRKVPQILNYEKIKGDAVTFIEDPGTKEKFYYYVRILSHRPRLNPRLGEVFARVAQLDYLRITRRSEENKDTPEKMDLNRHQIPLYESPRDNDGDFEYYIRFPGFDHRWDRWVTANQIVYPADSKLKVLDNFGDKVELGRLSVALAKPPDYKQDEYDDWMIPVRNVNNIVIGDKMMNAWYFSPFPPEYHNHPILYFCEFCLDFFVSRHDLATHYKRCKIRHPPGVEIYRSNEHNCVVSVFEVDGETELRYCQNLCYIARLFLEHKNLSYSTDIFLFYVVCEVMEDGFYFRGFFSKEKHSEKNNLACILTLPCFQRQGIGKFMISFSYALSHAESKFGTPERPLSDLGEISYYRYWSQQLLKFFVDYQKRALQSHHPNQMITLKKICDTTMIHLADVKHVLQTVLGMLSYSSGTGWVLKIPKDCSFLLTSIFPPKKKNPNKKFISVIPLRSDKLRWVPFNKRKPVVK